MLICDKLKIFNGETKLLDISFAFAKSLAIVGQSGSGKSLTLKAILGLLPKSLKYEIDLRADFEMRAGESVAFIPQNPFTALSPMTKIKDQFFAPAARIRECIEMVELEAKMLNRFPSELSGGQLQRVIIAIALSQNPRLLLLDEPTTALDFDTKEKIVKLLERLHKSMGFLMLFVTHELSLAKNLCDEIVVLKKGEIVERGKSLNVFENPSHIYTKTLLEAGFDRRSFRV